MTLDQTTQLSGYYLKRDDMVLGTLLPYDLDWPWILCSFQPTAAYALVRPLFEHAQRLYEALDQAADEDYEALSQQCEAALQAISNSGLVLEDRQTGHQVHRFQLYIRGETAEMKIHPTPSR